MASKLAKGGALALALGILGLRLVTAGSTGCASRAPGGTADTAQLPTPPPGPDAAAGAASPLPSAPDPALASPPVPGLLPGDYDPSRFPPTKAAPMFYPQQPYVAPSAKGPPNAAPQTPPPPSSP